MKLDSSLNVVDLFSGCGGMSLGFARRKPFQLVAAVDREVSKPSQKHGALGCNSTYRINLNINPLNLDLYETSPDQLAKALKGATRGKVCVLAACPPCTDFSRAKPTNHLIDSEKNSLVVKCADFVDALKPEFLVMENARELIMGKNAHHYGMLVRRLKAAGYEVHGEVLMLTKFGLPQIRERAIFIASRVSPVRTLSELWEGWALDPKCLTVRHALRLLPGGALEAGEAADGDDDHQSPGFSSDLVRRRTELIPADGGSWFDLAGIPGGADVLIHSMRNRLKNGDIGSHPDVYGRVSWDKPAPTIKRECAHVGNGRYTHPEQNRLLTVREMALLNGFPLDFVFGGRSLSNRYRHVGDAVPPLISYQLSALVHWMKTGVRPHPEDWILPGTSLGVSDVVPITAIHAEQAALSISG